MVKGKSGDERGNMNTLLDHAENVFLINNPSEIRDVTPEILKAVRKSGFAAIRGLIDRNEIRSKLAAIREFIQTEKAKPSDGVSKEDIRKNISKWSIGSKSKSQSGISRFFLTVMNPMREEDIFGLRKYFRKLIMVRDIISDRETYLFDENLPKPKFNGTRLQFYPTGGGFMTAHIDTKGVDNVAGISGEFIQVLLMITEKGTDYTYGGGYVELDGKVIDVEEGSLSGDILVYDGNTLHGVEDIDPQLPFDMTSISGRIVAFTTIYD